MKPTYQYTKEYLGLEDDLNLENRYFLTRLQLEELYCILMDSITSTIIERCKVNRDDYFVEGEEIIDIDFETTKWRFMTDDEMVEEVGVHQDMPENDDERHKKMLELLSAVIRQRLPTRKNTMGIKHIYSAKRK